MIFPPNKSRAGTGASVLSWRLIPTWGAEKVCQVTLADHFQRRWTSQNPPSQTQVYKDSTCGSGSQGAEDEPVSWIATEVFYLLLWNNEAKKLTLVQSCQFLFPDKAVKQKSISSYKVKHYQLFCAQAGEGRWNREITEHAFSHSVFWGWFLNHKKFFREAGLPVQGPRE